MKRRTSHRPLYEVRSHKPGEKSFCRQYVRHSPAIRAYRGEVEKGRTAYLDYLSFGKKIAEESHYPDNCKECQR